MDLLEDEFESIAESSPLIAELRARIEREGAITFRDFMDAALYHPRHGYYNTNLAATSRGGDYVTSPEVHSIFGALVAKQLCELWTAMSRPERFEIVEQGAGTGSLARDILRWAEREPEFFAAIRYQIVETSEVLVRMQRESLSERGLDTSVAWHGELPTLISGCVITNELLDAFPVHRVVRLGDELREVYVAWHAGRFVDELRPLSDVELARYFEAIGVWPGEGCYAEVNLQAPRWTAAAAASLERGYVLTFDYGYEAPQLYAPWRRDGTLVCYYRQAASSDPYQRVGKQDITASIDFTTVRSAGERAGLRTLGFTDQGQFLVRLGIGNGIASAASPGCEQIEEYFSRRRVVMDLIDPGRLGRVQVLLQGKNVDEMPLRGFDE